MELEWTPAAFDDLDEAGRFIADDSPADAARVGERILEAAEGLLDHPNLGRAGRVRATRELVISGTPLILVYRVHLDEIQVLRMLHHARRWPAH